MYCASISVLAVLLNHTSWAVITSDSSKHAPRVFANEEYTQLYLENRLLLEATQDGYQSLLQLSSSPTGEHFLVIACGYECNDNPGFLFRADGTAKRKVTGQWDYISGTAVEWSAEGGMLYYYRINSSGAEPPREAPRPGWVQVDLKTGRKFAATARVLKPAAAYRVFNVLSTDVLNVRRQPGVTSAVAGTLPYDAVGVRVTGAAVKVGKDRWVPITHQNLSGWVNQNFLCEETVFHAIPARPVPAAQPRKAEQSQEY